MAKALSDATLDATLGYIASSNILHICSAQPANYAGIAAVSLADVAVTPGDGAGDFTIANGDVSGRKLTVAAQTAVTVDSTGTANHLVLALSSDSTLRAVTTFTGQALTAGNTIDVAAFDIELQDPA